MIVAFLRLVRDFLCSSVANLWTFFKFTLSERRLTASHGEDASEVNAVVFINVPFFKGGLPLNAAIISLGAVANTRDLP